MIKIYMYNEKWRLQIGDSGGETLEFEETEQLLEIINTLVFMKNKYGRGLK